MIPIQPVNVLPARGGTTGSIGRGWFPGLLALVGLLGPGCAPSHPPAYPVSGLVRFEDGTPVRTGVVELESVELSVNARGEIRRDGSFQLTTWSTNDGAVAGKHRAVVVQPFAYAGLSGAEPQDHHEHETSTAPRVAPEMGQYETSQLEVTVQPQPLNEVVIVVPAAR